MNSHIQMMCDSGPAHGANRTVNPSKPTSVINSFFDQVTFKVKRQKQNKLVADPTTGPVTDPATVQTTGPVANKEIEPENTSTTAAIKLLINNEAEFEKLKQDIEKNAAATVDEKHVLSHLGDY
jgi:hypothetical protein